MKVYFVYMLIHNREDLFVEVCSSMEIARQFISGRSNPEEYIVEEMDVL